MDVFISWAGTRSLAAAEALKDWIPMLINAAKPWLSKAHIPSGRLWRTELAENLSSCKFGIFCLTPSSLESRWMYFEAGAISKTLADAHVCPLLIDLKPSDVESPFADFQCRIADKEGVFALMQTLNAALPTGSAVPEGQLRIVFDLLYGKLEEKFKTLPPDEAETRPVRQPNEILEEILTRVRAIQQREFFVSTNDLTDAELLQQRLKIRAGHLEEALSQAFPNAICNVSVLRNDFRVTVTDIPGDKSTRAIFPSNAPVEAILRKVSHQLAHSNKSDEKSAEPAAGLDI
jgi:hypothetical protein